MKRALVVDDDRPTRRVLQILFERLGLDSVAFEGPEPALEVLREESVSLILTDLRMPRMNGIEFMRALRERIFQPFVTSRDGGVGLGLTFVKRVVHEHQGRIFLEPGARGACFRVELPVAGEST